MSRPVQIFIAYSRKDSALLDEFREHLTPLERTGKVRIWYDGLIEPGAVWEADIKKHLHGSDIILLMVSAGAIASDYFYDKEVADALERHHKGEARVVPMIMRACAWDATPLADLQALPKNGKPVTSWTDRDEAYADAAKALWMMIIHLEQLKAEAAEQVRLQKEAEQQEQFTAEQARKAAQLAKEEEARRQKEAEAQRAEEERRRKEEAEQKALLARQAEYGRYMAEAQKHLRRRDWPRANTSAQAALALAPGDADALRLISQAEEGSRQPAPPKPPYLRWAGIAAGVLLAIFIIVKLTSGPHKESEAQKAEREYAEAWRRAEAENTLPAWREFLKIYPGGDRKDAAQQQVNSLEIKLKALLNDADVLLDIGDKAGACNDLRNALRIAPNDPDILQRIKKAGCPPAQ